MGDKIAFVLPNTLEEALWAIPCISQHLENRLVTKREAEKVYCFCPIVDIWHLLEACWKGMIVGRLPIPEEIRNEVDVMFEFDPEKAYRLTSGAGKHIVEAYGMMLGTVSLSLLPPIASVTREVPGNVLVVGRHKADIVLYTNEWDHAENFVRMGKAFGIEVSRLDPNLEWQEMVDEIARASVIVGVRGTPTLVAAAIGRSVMELSPEESYWTKDKSHKNWMSKWENKKYGLVHGDLQDMDAIFVWERTRQMIEDRGQREAKRFERRSVQGRDKANVTAA